MRTRHVRRYGDLAARVIVLALAHEIVDAFLGARSSGNERHVRRLNKLKAQGGPR